MTVVQPSRTPRPGWRSRLLVITSAGVLAACSTQPTPSPAESPSLAPSSAPSASAEPTATPIPRLILPAPTKTDPISIQFTLKLKVDRQAGGSGKLTVVVTNLTQQMVPELVLRWPTAVRDTISLAPFEPSQVRIREGGDPLVQSWTKWVDGPGELGEPAGTTSLGWGPLLPGGTLTIPVLATRVAPGPITFDFQILNGEAMLTTATGPAWIQVTVQ